MRRAYPTRSIAIVVLGVLVPLALLPILAAARAPWTVSSPLPEQVFVSLSAIGGGTGAVVLAGVAVYGLIRQGHRWDAAFMIAAVVGAHVSGRLLKDAFDAARPPSADVGTEHLVGIPESAVLVIVAAMVAIGYFTRWRRSVLVAGAAVAGLLLVEAASDLLVPLIRGMDSFPSGHGVASMAFVLSATIVSWNTRWRWVVLVSGAVLVVGVGASRVYLGVHDPADVVGGWCVAVASVTTSWLILQAIRDRIDRPDGQMPRWLQGERSRAARQWIDHWLGP
jgi:membrane-associated phospholipid phosphatase